MKDYAKERAEAAKWMWDRKDRPVEWWRWQVLTGHNSDPDTLGLDEKTAYLIFADLVHDGLLVPTIGSDGREAYSVNPGKDANWKRMMSPFRYWVAHHILQLFFWLVGAIGGGVVGLCIGLWWNKMIGE